MKSLTKLQRIAYNAIRWLDNAGTDSEIRREIRRIERRFGFVEEQ